MNAFEIGCWRRVLLLAFVLSLTLPGRASAATEETFPLLSTRVGTFTNVTVTTKKKDYVFILHAGGMANIRVADLSEEALAELGYVSEEKKAAKASPARLAKEILPAVEARLEPIQTQLQSTLRERLPAGQFAFGSPKALLGIAAGVFLLLHLFFSYCCHLIVIKSKKDPSPLTWIPMLQWIPLLRAADMSGWLFLLMFVPVVPIMWAFKIAKARGMGALVSIFLILPVTSPFAFMYLAFKKETPPEEPRYKSMSLQTA